MKRRLAIVAIGFLAMGTTSLVAAGAPAVGAAAGCSTTAPTFRVDPSPARLTADDTIVKTFTGRCLEPNSTYVLHEPACGIGRDKTLTADSLGTAIFQKSLTNCVAGSYDTTLTEAFGSHRKLTFTEKLQPAAACAPGSKPSISTLPSNAPRYDNSRVRQTLVGECFVAFAPVRVALTACGGSIVTATTDRFGRFYAGFRSKTCFSGGSFPITVLADYPPFGAILATGTQTIEL